MGTWSTFTPYLNRFEKGLYDSMEGAETFSSYFPNKCRAMPANVQEKWPSSTGMRPTTSTPQTERRRQSTWGATSDSRWPPWLSQVRISLNSFDSSLNPARIPAINLKKQDKTVKGEMEQADPLYGQERRGTHPVMKGSPQGSALTGALDCPAHRVSSATQTVDLSSFSLLRCLSPLGHKQACGIHVPKREGSGQGVPQTSVCGTASSQGKWLVYQAFWPQQIMPEPYSAGTIFEDSDLLAVLWP